MIRKMLIAFALFGLLFTVGYSAFNVRENGAIAYIDPNNSENILISDRYVIFDYNDGNYTNDYYCNLTAEGKIDAASVPQGNSVTGARTFKGWSRDKKGTSMIADLGTATFSHGEILYAQYAQSKISLGDSTVINSGSYSNPYYFMNDTISSGQQVNISYGTGSYSDSTGGSNTNVLRVSEASINVVLQSDLVVDGGTLSLTSVLGYASTGSTTQQLISGEFVTLDLNGYTVRVQNGGTINGYGMIYNTKDTGGIIVENGTLITPFCVYDFKGGTYLLTAYNNGVMPFTNYFAPYLACESVFYNQGKLVGEASLCVQTLTTKYSTKINFIGNPSDGKEYFIALKNGYVVRRTENFFNNFATFQRNINVRVYDYVGPDYREKLIFTDDPASSVKNLDGTLFAKSGKCSVDINSLSLTLQGKTAQLKYVDFPISSFFDIELYNTNIYFGISFVFLPSSSFYCDRDSVIKMGYSSTDYSDSGYYIMARINVMDEYSKDFAYYNGSARTGGGGLSQYLNRKLIYDTECPKIKIDGTFEFDTGSSVLNMNKNYAYYTIGGKIECSDAALEAICRNSAYIKTVGRFFFPFLVSDGDATDSAIKYCSRPLYSGNKAYFQKEGETDVRVGDYSEEKNLIRYEGGYYFYKYTSGKFSQSSYSTGLLGNLLSSASKPPNASKAEEKHSNLDGGFVACTVKNHRFNDRIDLPYITSGGQSYIYILGAYTTLTKEVDDIIAYLSATDSKFLIPVGDCRPCNSAYYDNSSKEWKFGYDQK